MSSRKTRRPPDTLPAVNGSEYELISSAHSAMVAIFKAIPSCHPGYREANSALLYLKAAAEYCRAHHNIAHSIYWQKSAVSVRIEIAEQLDRLKSDICENIHKFGIWWDKFLQLNEPFLDSWLRDYVERMPHVRAGKKNIPNIGDLEFKEMKQAASHGLKMLWRCREIYSQKLLEANQ